MDAGVFVQYEASSTAMSHLRFAGEFDVALGSMVGSAQVCFGRLAIPGAADNTASVAGNIVSAARVAVARRLVNRVHPATKFPCV